MIIRIIVALFAFGILYCLASAAYCLIRSTNSSLALLGSLTWRVLASVVLFLLILLSYSLGWINPHPAAFLLKLEAAQKHGPIVEKESHDGGTPS
jgi:hypothetical protein